MHVGDLSCRGTLLHVGYDVAYLRISKVSIYISSPQELVRYHGLFDIDYHSKLKE